MRVFRLLVMVVSVFSIVSACSTIPKPGKKYGKPIPQQIRVTTRLATGEKIQTLIWNHPKSFGPVPKHLKGIAMNQCKAFATANHKVVDLSGLKAIGYHPEARDVNGRTIKGGGYYCNISTRYQRHAKK